MSTTHQAVVNGLFCQALELLPDALFDCLWPSEQPPRTCQCVDSVPCTFCDPRTCDDCYNVASECVCVYIVVLDEAGNVVETLGRSFDPHDPAIASVLDQLIRRLDSSPLSLELQAVTQ